MTPVCHKPLTPVQRRNLLALLIIQQTKGRPATVKDFIGETGLSAPHAHRDAYAILSRKGCLGERVPFSARARVASGYILALPGADGVRLTALSPDEGRALVERLTKGEA